MPPEIQTLLALIVVALAGAYLLRALLKKGKNPGCSSGCACPTSDLKAQLKPKR